MGYFGKLKQRNEAIRLRSKGLSVRNIEKIVKVSRSSISIWTRNILLTDEQQARLQSNKVFGQKKGSQIAAARKIEQRLTTTKQLLEEGKNEVKSTTKRDRFIFGIGLYFSEGDKSDKYIGFTNSDERSIKFMVNWFDEFCNIPKEGISCYLYIHDTINEEEAKKYWSKITDIPLKQFKRSYIVKNNPDRLRKTKHEYGICRLIIGDVNKLRKIMGWISGVFGV